MTKRSVKRARGRTYLLDRIPDLLMDSTQRRAVGEGRTVKFVLLELMRLYARFGLEAIKAGLKGR